MKTLACSLLFVKRLHELHVLGVFVVEISPNTFEYQPGPGVPVKKIVMPTGQYNMFVIQ